jgi:hypothetical protein
VPSGEKTTEVMARLWALVFSATQLMSIAIILRTREKRRERLRQRVYSAAWRYGTTRGCKLKGASGVSMQTCNHQQRAARMRGIACGVWFRSSSRTESRMPSREAAQLGVSGLGSHVAAKRAGAERREADFCRRATAERHAKKPTVVRETKGGVGARACVLPEMHKCPRAPCGRKHLPGSGLDVFRVRSGLRVQRSHRRTLST